MSSISTYRDISLCSSPGRGALPLPQLNQANHRWMGTCEYGRVRSFWRSRSWINYGQNCSKILKQWHSVISWQQEWHIKAGLWFTIWCCSSPRFSFQKPVRYGLSYCLLHTPAMKEFRRQWHAGSNLSTARRRYGVFGSSFRAVRCVNGINQSTYIGSDCCSHYPFRPKYGVIYRRTSLRDSQRSAVNQWSSGFVDRFSKFTHFIALSHPYSAALVAKAFKGIVQLHAPL
jgi:hypothetical protein